MQLYRVFFVLHIIHKYKSVMMKTNCHSENFHVHIKIYINIKIIKTSHWPVVYNVLFYYSYIYQKTEKLRQN